MIFINLFLDAFLLDDPPPMLVNKILEILLALQSFLGDSFKSVYIFFFIMCFELYGDSSNYSHVVTVIAGINCMYYILGNISYISSGHTSGLSIRLPDFKYEHTSQLLTSG